MATTNLDNFKPKRKLEVRGFVQNFNNRLCRLLDQITARPQDPKDLIFPDKVRSLFELVIDQKRLKQRTVSLTTLNKHSINLYQDASDSHVVFIIPATKFALRMVEAFITSVKKKEISKKYSLIVFPKRNVVLQFLIRKYKLHLDLMSNIYDFNFDLIPLSHDLLSLENDDALREVYLTKEFGSMNLVSQSINKLQLIFGKARAWFGKGAVATEVVKMCRRGEKVNAKIMDKCEEGKKTL